MLSRFLPAIVLVMAMGDSQTAGQSAGQSALSGKATGQPTRQIRAGDVAPDPVFSQVLSAPVPGSSAAPNMAGHVTVLSFFPDTSDNPGPVEAWNTFVKDFAEKHVQFVWITGEERRTLMPALARHPIRGWVLYDPDGSTAKAYGLDMPVTVYIGTNRRIVGFQQGALPNTQVLNAVLEGRVVLTRPMPETLTSFRENNLMALDSVPARMPKAEDYRPKFAPSTTVHITPSTASARDNSSSDDYWALRGFTLKEAIEEIYDVTPPRIELPLALGTAKRYDFAMSLPHAEQREEMKEQFKRGLQEFFHLSVDREERLADVYVVSHEPGHKPPIERPVKPTGHPGGGSEISTVGLQAPGDSETSTDAPGPQGLDALFGIAEEGTMDDLCRVLEGSLDRPVVNETHLEGSYRIDVGIPLGSKENFLTMLRERTGLVIRSGQRRITFLKFKTVEDRRSGQ